MTMLGANVPSEACGPYERQAYMLPLAFGLEAKRK